MIFLVNQGGMFQFIVTASSLREIGARTAADFDKWIGANEAAR